MSIRHWRLKEKTARTYMYCKYIVIIYVGSVTRLAWHKRSRGFKDKARLTRAATHEQQVGGLFLPLRYIFLTLSVLRLFSSYVFFSSVSFSLELNCVLLRYMISLIQLSEVLLSADSRKTKRLRRYIFDTNIAILEKNYEYHKSLPSCSW